ncbi:hydrolase [Actinomycetospora sp. NBRC 106375]|uniref:alpha/beta fold hydrolase n=1 Tax=Actinomycetospora sp. NBRC 106375 TaxID=3032207 RepID=UPI0024A29F72|nr:alpha/beta hydrolase [Actinomycetospora sp. NBRC 106375]GLZ45036.1 hydrolase [Actinomycetospora sp. NBRC 106375]
MPVITANGTDIHHEILGSGPPLLFTSGAGGDAGYWTATATRLADRYTVVTYDRRGNSRSPAPPGAGTSLAEQADDAAALLRVLDLAPATVVGNSLGAIITAELVERHPMVVEHAVLHEPPLLSVVPDAAEVGAQLEALIGEGMAGGGPPVAMERFLRAVWHDDVFDDADPQLAARLLANGEVFFRAEMPLVAEYVPEPESLGDAGVPLIVAAGRDNRGMYLHTGTAWLADRLGLPLRETSGAHVPYLDRPTVFAAELAGLLSEARVG